MSARLSDNIMAYRHQRPVSFTLAAAAIGLALLFWAALIFFKPVGKRRAKNGMAMAALEFPEMFAKARAEVYRVCGVGEAARLPILENMDSSRYICAMGKEVLRWRPIFPLTPDHVASQDIEFEGYYFPAGTRFVINGHAVYSECENPDAFQPERWLDGHETDIAHGLWQFGGGRRICVGYRLAQRSLFINMARLVQCVDYSPVS